MPCGDLCDLGRQSGENYADSKPRHPEKKRVDIAHSNLLNGSSQFLKRLLRLLVLAFGPLFLGARLVLYGPLPGVHASSQGLNVLLQCAHSALEVRGERSELRTRVSRDDVRR